MALIEWRKDKITRREASRDLLLAAASLAFPIAVSAEQSKRSGFLIGACDWSIQGHSTVEALYTAQKIGLDGVQLSLGTAANDMHLRRPEVQQAYREASKKTGVKFGGLAIGEMNSIPYKSDPRTEQWVDDSIDVAKAMGCQVVLLAFFGNGDLKNDKPGTQEVVRRLKKVAPKAEKNGVILAIESWLSAEEHMQIIDAVGSTHVRVYYDVANATQMGYDIYREIPFLGKQICEVHMKENGALLGKGIIDFEKVRRALDEIGYRGWIHIEGAVPKGGDMLESYIANCKYLRRIFPA
jgi:L-ribulose-5-phosphate 3-epimerase